MDICQPSLFPELVKDIPDHTRDFVLDLPPLPAVPPKQWALTDMATRKLALMAAYNMADLDNASKVTGLPLTTWHKEDLDFKREWDRARATRILEMEMYLIQQMFQANSKTLQAKFFDRLHQQD